MSVTTITPQNYDEVINKEGFILIDFWADWCGPCKVMTPIFESLAEAPEFSAVEFGSVDVDASGELADKFQVTGIPAFFLLKRDGKGSYELVQKMTGTQDGLTFKQTILSAIS